MKRTINTYLKFYFFMLTIFLSASHISSGKILSNLSIKETGNYNINSGISICTDTLKLKNEKFTKDTIITSPGIIEVSGEISAEENVHVDVKAGVEISIDPGSVIEGDFTFSIDKGLANNNVTNTFSKNNINIVSLDIYPNPALNTIRVISPEKGIGTLEVYDIKGVLKKSLLVDQTIMNVELNDLPEGVYFVEVKKETIIRRKKLVIQK